MNTRLSTLALAVALLAPAVAAQDPLRLQLFSGVDREAVEVGELLQVDVEALAVPEGAAEREALAEAFGSWDVSRQLGPAFEVIQFTGAVSRETGDVVEMQRRLVVRVREAVDAVPALHFDVSVRGRTRTYGTRAHALRTFADAAPAEVAARSVVSVTAEGEFDGIGFERLGSAFVVGGDALVTAYHVVVGARRVRVRLPNGGEVLVGRAWVLDPERDVAVLHLPSEVMVKAGLRPLVIAPDAGAGAVAFTAGWPERHQRQTVAARFDDLALDGQRLRVSANAVLPGDSGGPLLDEAGRVLGVVVSGRGVSPSDDLLRESICLASDLRPALDRYRETADSTPLDRAQSDAAEVHAAARAHAAAGAIEVPTRRIDRSLHLALLRDALRQSPDDPVLLYLAGTVLEEAGERGLAAGAFDAAHRAGYVPAGYSLAHHLLGAGRLPEAAALFAEAAEDGSYRRLGAFGLAQALVGMGRYDEAEAALATVLDHDARFAPALYLLGVVRLAQGRDAEAGALAVRLRTRPGWAASLRLPIEAEGLRPPRLEPLPRVALR